MNVQATHDLIRGEKGEVFGEAGQLILGDGAGTVFLGADVRGYALDLCADGDVVLNLYAGEVLSQVIDHAFDLLFKVGESAWVFCFLDGSDGFARTEDAEAVAGVSGDAALLEVERTCVAGADMGHHGQSVSEGAVLLQQAQGGQVDEAGHLALIEQAHIAAGGYLQTIEEDLGVGGLTQDVSGVKADARRGDAILAHALHEVAQDGGGLLHGAAGDGPSAEDVARGGQGFIEELKRGDGAIGSAVTDDEGDRGRTHVDESGLVTSEGIGAACDVSSGVHG